MFRIRVDIVNDLNSDQLVEVCSPNSYVIVRHELPHGNPHYHAYFKFDTDIKDNTLRQRFKRKFTQLKSSDYSIKKCDEGRVNEYVQYMFNTKHGNKWELIDVHNFDAKLLDDLKKAAQTISDDFAESKSKSNSKGPTIWDIAQEVEQIVSPKLTVNDLGSDQIKVYRRMADEIEVYTNVAIQTMRKYRKPFDEFLLRKVISTAMSSTTRGREAMRLKMVQHFMPRDI